MSRRRPGLCLVAGCVIPLLIRPAVQAFDRQDAVRGRSAQQRQTPVAPPGWTETLRTTLDLTVAGKHAEVIAIYEKWVADHPNFAQGHVMLAGACESCARAVLMSRAADAGTLSVKYFEAAARHLRRALALDADPTFMTMRSLIDLHGPIGLNRPAEYERLVAEGLRRYPAEPLAHAYFIALIGSRAQPIDGAVRAARAATPKTAQARTDLASALAQFATEPGGAATGPLLAEALGLADEALAMNPASVPALEEKARILRAQAARTGEPARARLLAEANRLGARAAQLRNR